MTKTYLSRDEAIKRIRAALKRRSGKDWSVRGGRGTAYGWIDIDAPTRRKTWRDVQTDMPEPSKPGAIYRGVLGITPHYRVSEGSDDQIMSPADDPWAREAAESGRSLIYNWEVEDPDYEFGHMSPADRVELARLLGLDRPVHCQGQQVSDDARAFFVARAEGK